MSNQIGKFVDYELSVFQSKSVKRLLKRSEKESLIEKDRGS